jgi:hypothetical protein
MRNFRCLAEAQSGVEGEAGFSESSTVAVMIVLSGDTRANNPA